MHFLCVVYLTTVKKFQNLQGCVWKAAQAWLGCKSYFSHTNRSNFQWPLQSLHWYIRLKIYCLLKFNMLFQLLLTNFSKSELFSCLQKVDYVTNYCKKKKTFATQPHPQDAFPWLLLPCLRQETIFHDPYSFHFEWGGLAQWNYSSNKIVCARHGQSWTPQPALESRPPKPCPVQRHILV